MTTDDTQAIRALISRWHAATAAGDIDTVLGLMAEDAVFLVAGQPPMRGRAAFGQALRSLLAHSRIESRGEVQEVEVCGDLAWAWSQLSVRIVPAAGGAGGARRSGPTLSVFRKQAGSWLLARDANLLTLDT